MDRQRIVRVLSILALSLALLLPLGAAACGSGSSTSGSSSLGAAVTAKLTASGNSSSAQTLQNATTELVSPAQIVAANVSASVVNVRVEGLTASPFSGQEQYEGVGSGIIYTSDGYILTNDHVVSLNGKAADSVQVTFTTGETVPATIVARDASNDLALLKVDKAGLAPVLFAKSSSVQVGQWAIAIGSPFDYSNSVSEGIVSGLNRDLETGDPTAPQVTGLLQTDAAISPGNSGGGLFNAASELIGMPEAYIPAAAGAENLGFAIPADKVATIATQLMTQQ